MLGIYHETQRVSLKIICEVEEEFEKSTGRKINVLRSYNRGEYKSDPFLKLCRDEGIYKHFTVRETSQQNGIAKRINKTLLEKIRYMISNAGLPKNFWAEVLAFACYLVNRLASSAIGGKILLEV